MLKPSALAVEVAPVSSTGFRYFFLRKVDTRLPLGRKLARLDKPSKDERLLRIGPSCYFETGGLMPRGRRRAPADASALEQELQRLKAQQAQLRQQLRLVKRGGAGVQKLEEKLEKQFAQAKWTVQQIQELQPDWDDVGFYQSVKAKQPAPRGRRPRAQAAADAS